MRSGIELLFLPRRMGRMPYGLVAERVGGQVTWIPVLRIRHAYNHRCAVRQDSVRLAMSLRAGAGPALQDTAKEKIRRLPGEKYLRKTRYVVLVVMCILLPMLAKGSYGVGMPWFCKWICPSGTLLGGIPLLALNEELRSVIGWLFTWKLFILVVIITGSILMYRPFCRYICPLGAIYGLMNPVSLVRMRVSRSRCVGCGACQKACGLDIPVYKEPNSTDCIRCGKCVTVCPHNALKLDVTLKGKRRRGTRQEDADA